MAQDFYRRAQILHEEFQKRELHYLNTEKKWNNMIWKKDLNMPLQEYLQKLDKREIETEETYKSVMKQMEELDKHTDLMSLKLERLGTLRNNITNVGTSNWLQTLTNSNSLSLEAANRLQTSANLNFSAQRQFLKSASTQTENKIYCDKCTSEILLLNQPCYPIETFMPPTIPEFQSSVGSIPPEAICSSKFLNSVTSSNETQNVSQFISSPALPEQSFMLPNANKSFTFGYKNIEQTDPESLKHINSGAVLENLSSVMKHNLQNTELLQHDINSSVITENSSVTQHNLLHNTQLLEHDINSRALTEHNSAIEHNLLQNNRLLKHNVDSGAVTEKHNSMMGHISLPNTSTSIPQTVESVTFDLPKSKSKSKKINEVDSAMSKSILNDETEKPDIIDNDASVSKSDAGSINHEFDFLESDTANVYKDAKYQVGLKTAETSSRNTSATFDQIHSSVESKEKSAIKSKNRKLDDIVDKSDSSGSVTGPQTPSNHSANLSLASDSDSIVEKETPLKASAAYQALLGNTTNLEKKEKQYSDSESEDEIENVLSNAVTKNSKIVPKPKQDAKNSQAKKDEKPGVPPSESKPANKPSLATKPQSKLSKSTKKVLCIETSSDSEVEISAKTPKKKIEEDEDEFGFFD